MRIIKAGKIQKYQFKGICVNCGCEVECEPNEVKKYYDQRDGDYYTVKCPTEECNHTIYLNEIKTL